MDEAGSRPRSAHSGTNALAKVLWKISISAHVSQRPMPKYNAAFAPAGAANGVKAVEQWLAHGPVLIGEIVDAYYTTPRGMVLQNTVGSALGPATSLIYGVPPACLIGKDIYKMSDGYYQDAEAQQRSRNCE
jgi:hypothetical protein